jgi:hypothetical protein
MDNPLLCPIITVYDHQRGGIADLGTGKTQVTDDHMAQTRVLKDHTRFAVRDADSAIVAKFLIDDIGACPVQLDCLLRAGLGALPTLYAKTGMIFTGRRKRGFNLQGSFLWIDFSIMLDGADLQAEATTRTIITVNLNPHMIFQQLCIQCRASAEIILDFRSCFFINL